jgi:hypothetical protein
MHSVGHAGCQNENPSFRVTVARQVGGYRCKNGLCPEISLWANQLDIGSGLPESPCNNLRSEGLLS